MADWSCRKCGVALVSEKVVFEYMGRSLSQEMFKCPRCGKVRVPAEIAEGKMAEAEMALEDK